MTIPNPAGPVEPNLSQGTATPADVLAQLWQNNADHPNFYKTDDDPDRPAAFIVVFGGVVKLVCHAEDFALEAFTERSVMVTAYSVAHTDNERGWHLFEEQFRSPPDFIATPESLMSRLVDISVYVAADIVLSA